MIEKPNLPARFARRLMMLAWRPSRIPRIVLAIVVATAWISFSIWASWIKDHAGPNPPGQLMLLFDLAYAPFRYISKSAASSGEAHIWQENVAHVAGTLVPTLGVFWLLRQKVMIWIAEALMRLGARDHAVIFASGGSGDALAIASSNDGDPVLLMDASIAGDEFRRSRLGGAGVIALPAPLAAAENVKRARAEQAATLAVWARTDTESLATALDLREHLHSEASEWHVAIRSVASQRALRHSPSLLQVSRNRLRPHAPEGAIWRQALSNTDLVAEAVGRQQASVCVCLWGSGWEQEWAIEMVLAQNWSIHLGAPRILLALPGALPDPDLHRLERASEVFEEEWVPVVGKASTEAAALDTAVTRHVVDMGSDDETLASTFALATRLRQLFESPPLVQAVFHGDQAADELFARSDLPLAPPIVLGKTPSLGTLVARPRDEAAARIHLRYTRQNAEDGSPASGRWQDLPETYVHANRAASDNISVKLWDIHNSALAGDALVEALARTEHHRWCTERLLDGWVPGERNNIRRTHPDLVPWAALDERARDKDRDQVRALLTAGADR